MEKNIITSGNNTVNNKIQDFGEKIGGARKDWFANIKEAARKFAEVGAVDLVTAPLSKVVTLPNLEKMTEAGALSTDSARAVMTIWRNLGTRPAGSAYLLQRWAEKAAPKLARIGAILNGDKVSDEERAAVDFRILAAANWPAVPFSFGRVETGRTYSGMMYAATGRYYIARSNNAADIVAAIRTQTEQDAQKRAEGVRLAICSNRVGEYFVTPEHKTEIVLFRGSYAECYDQKEHHADELRARYAEIKNVPALRRDWNRPRVGEDWRKGQDITPETFAGALPFRGVEFGNWVTQAERASLLNAAFDGFHDLAQMLGVSVERMTLGGTLAFAFASRGTSKAMAHYEPGRQVINLTKKKGAGCMAHEWFHACDHSAARLGGLPASLMATERAADTEAGRYATAISQAIKNTEFYHRSLNLAPLCGGYWVQPCELPARAFEGVCAYLLKRAGVCSDFLVNCLSMDEFTATDTLHRSDIYPYPSEAEAAALVPYYMSFFRALFGEGAELSAEQLADISAQQEKANQERAEAIAQREEAERKRTEEIEAKRKAKAEENEQKLAEAFAKHRAELPALMAKAEADGVQDVATLATCSGAVVAGVLGGYIVAYWTKHDSTEERAVMAYKRNGRLRKGARVDRLYIESTQQTAAEYLQSISKAGEMTGYYVGAYGLHDIFSWWSQSAATFADLLSKAQDAEKHAQERANVADLANTKAEAEKATVHSENTKKGNRSDVDTTAAPADGLQLVEIAGGVAVIGDTRTTYRNRREIKAHGGTWNKTAQRWEATEAEKVAQLRAWFAQTEQTSEATAEACTEANTEPGAPVERQGVELNAEASTETGTPSEGQAWTIKAEQVAEIEHKPAPCPELSAADEYGERIAWRYMSNGGEQLHEIRRHADGYYFIIWGIGAKDGGGSFDPTRHKTHADALATLQHYRPQVEAVEPQTTPDPASIKAEAEGAQELAQERTNTAAPANTKAEAEGAQERAQERTNTADSANTKAGEEKTTESTTEEAQEEAETEATPAEGQGVAKSEAVACGSPHYSACEKSPNLEPSGAGTPSAPSCPCWGVFMFGDVDGNSYEPQMIKSFDTETQARKWLRQCADCACALSADHILACAGGYWVVWYDRDRSGYYCQFVAPRADAHDLSGALLRCESLHLRRRVHEFKRKHIARQMAKEVAKIQAGEMLTVEYCDMVASVKIGGYGFRRYEFTLWIRNRIRERRCDLTAAEAAQAVADFVAYYVPARDRASHDCQLHTFAITATDYDSPETPPYAAAFQSVDCTPEPSQVAPRA